MSGPKTSFYGVSAEVRANLMEQLSCQQKIAACAQRLDALVLQLAAEDGENGRLCELFEMLASHTGKGREQAAALQQAREEARSELDGIRRQLKELGSLDFPRPTYSEVELSRRRMILTQITCLHEMGKLVKEGLDSAASPLRDNEETARAILRGKLDETIAAHADFSPRPDENPQDSLPGFREMQRALHTAAEDKRCPRYLFKACLRALDSMDDITDADRWRNALAVHLKPLLYRVQKETAEWQQRYDEARAAYASLCTLLGKGAEAFPVTPDGLTAMEQATEALQAEVLHEREQAHVCECVRQVMAEMGYDLLGGRDVVKRSGRSFRNELYHFEDGRALSVTHASDGQITIELGGLGREDRLPDAAEAALLRSDMDAFCASFHEVEKRLNALGVKVRERVRLLPPDEAFATIINLTDYDLTGSAPVATLAETGAASADSAAAQSAAQHMNSED